MRAWYSSSDSAVMTEPERRLVWLNLGQELGVLTDLQEEAMVLWATGVGYKRVGHVLGVPRETARSRIQRGLERIHLVVRPQDLVS